MKPLRTLRRAIAWTSLGVAGGALIVTTRHLLATPQPLESVLPGEGRIDRRAEGTIYYNVAGPAGADALVLVHDFYPGASNFEFRRVFARLAETHRVYAPDWLGFGMSERPALAYTGEFYAHLLREFLRQTVGRPAAVLAHGLAGNVAVRAASDEPALFARQVLVAPRTRAGIEEAPSLGQSLVRGAQRSSLGLVPYATVSTRAALRWQLQRRAARPGQGAATDDAVDHLYASAHQFGAEFAPLAHLTGELDLPLANALALLEPPVLVVAGERDTLQSRAELEDLVLVNPHAQLLVISDAGDAIYEDAPDTFVDRTNLWLSSPRPRQQPRLTDIMRAGPGAPLPPREGREERAVPPVSLAPGASLHGGIVGPEEDQQDQDEEAEEAAAAVAAQMADEREAEEAEREAEDDGLDESFVPLDQAETGEQIEQTEQTERQQPEPVPGEPRFDATSPTPEMIGTRGDIRAEAAPAYEERELEASDEAQLDDAADAAQEHDSLRASMSAPEAPVPTTLAAMTAPLDETAPRPEEGPEDPLSGPHPVPADARESEQAEQAEQAEQMSQEPTTSAAATTPTSAADATIIRNEAARVSREDEAAQARETANLLAQVEDQVGQEAARLDERIQAAGPATERGATQAAEEPTTEAEVPPAAATNDIAEGMEATVVPAPEPAAQPEQARASQSSAKASANTSAEAPRTAPSQQQRTAAASQRASGSSGAARQASGRTGAQPAQGPTQGPATGKGAGKSGGAQSRAPGQSGGQSSGTKRQGGRKTKHSHR